MDLRCSNAQGDPFKTLFVARVSYDATEKKLKREFEEYGPVKSVRLVTQKDSGELPSLPFMAFCPLTTGLAILLLKLTIIRVLNSCL